MTRTSLFLVAFALSMLSLAHPGQDKLSRGAEAAARREYLSSLDNTDLAHCAQKLAIRGVVERTVMRRKHTLAALRKRIGVPVEGEGESCQVEHRLELKVQGLEKRQQKFGFKDNLAKDHKSTLNLASSWTTADWTLLGRNQSVVLQPETAEGPYCKLIWKNQPEENLNSEQMWEENTSEKTFGRKSEVSRSTLTFKS
jgi:hypothetical protein